MIAMVDLRAENGGAGLPRELEKPDGHRARWYRLRRCVGPLLTSSHA
jgi:hypothetical protein